MKSTNGVRYNGDYSNPGDTFSALDAMDENLRRLGLSNEAATDPIRGEGTGSSIGYMTRIRAAKEERARLRREKDLRRFVSDDQQPQKVEADVHLQTQHHQQQQKNLGEDTGGASALVALRTDGKQATAQAQIRALAEAQGRERVAQQAKEAELARSVLAAAEDQRVHALRATQNGRYSSISSGVFPQQEEQYTAEASCFCREVTHGLVDLAIRVSDSRFLAAEGVEGGPVRRTSQDLGVTQWKEWVQECIHLISPTDQKKATTPTAAAATTAVAASKEPGQQGSAVHNRRDSSVTFGAGHRRELLETPNTFGLFDDVTEVSGALGAAQRQARVEADAALEALRRDEHRRKASEENLAFAAEAQGAHDRQFRRGILQECVEVLQGEGERLRKIALESIRRQYNETVVAVANSATSLSTGSINSVRASMSIATTATGVVCREEILPNWAQVMPPAGCFLHGDDLSGVRLLAETVDTVVMNAQRSQNQNQSLQPEDVAAFASATAAVASPGAAGSRHHQLAASAVAAFASATSVSTGHSVGVTVNEGSGLSRTFLTPRTLLGTATTARSRINSAGRTRLNNKVSSHRTSATADDEDRKEMETLTDALARELTAAHARNLHVLTSGRVPLVQPLNSFDHAPTISAGAGAGAGQKGGKGQGAGGGQQGGQQSGGGGLSAVFSQHKLPVFAAVNAGEAGKEAEEDVQQMKCIFLVGFPESEAFYQMLENKLQVTVDAMEMEMVLTEYRRAEQEAEAAALSSGALAYGSLSGGVGNGTIGKTKGVSSPAKPKAAAGGVGANAALGAASNNSGRQNRNAKGQPPPDDDQLITNQLHARKAFPPLCVVGCFLVYDLTTRHNRLRDAYVRGDNSISNAGASPAAANVTASGAFTPSTSVSAMGGTAAAAAAAATNNANASAAATAAAATATAMGFGISGSIVSSASTANSVSSGAHLSSFFPYLYVPLCHTVYNPEIIMAGAPTSQPQSQPQGPGTPSNKEVRHAPTSSPLLNLAIKSFKRGIGNGGKRIERVCETWGLERLRGELFQQDRRMRRWQKQWCNAFTGTSSAYAASVAAVAAAIAAASGVGGGAPAAATGHKGAGNAATRERDRSASKKRQPEKPKSGGQESRRDSTKNMLNSHNAAGDSNTRTAATIVRFPNVLFFFRKEDVSDAVVAATKKATAAAAADLNNGNVSIYPCSIKDHLTDDTERKRRDWVDYLVSRACAITTQLSGRLFTNESLAPLQLPAPLRISDYRLPPNVCTDLVFTYEQYTSLLVPASLSPVEFPLHTALHGSNFHVVPAIATEEVAEVGELRREEQMDEEKTRHMPALGAEMELLRAFSLYVLHLRRTLRHDAFPAFLWGGTAANSGTLKTADGTVQQQDLNNTLHYTSIDRNYESVRAELGGLASDFEMQLRLRCGLLLRHAVDAAVMAAAAALEEVCELVEMNYYALSTAHSAPRQRSQVVGPRTGTSTTANSAGDEVSEGGTGCGSVDYPSNNSQRFTNNQQDNQQLETQQEPSAVCFVRESFLSSVRRLAVDETQELVSAFFLGYEDPLGTFWSTLGAYARDVAATLRESFLHCLSAVREMHETAKAAEGSAGPCRAIVDLVNWDQYSYQLMDRIMTSTFGEFNTAGTSSGDARLGGGEAGGARRLFASGSASESEQNINTIFSRVHRGDAAPLIARCAVVLRELTRSFIAGRDSALRWLEVMYVVALSTPCVGPFPASGRPRSVADLFTPPEVPEAELGNALRQQQQHQRQSYLPEVFYEYGWHETLWELYVSSLSIYGRAYLGEAEYIHCNLLQQLFKQWQYQEDCCETLAAEIAFPSPPPLPQGLAPDCAYGVTHNCDDVEESGCGCVETECTGQMPLWFSDALLVAPCRPTIQQSIAAGTGEAPLPFLTVEDLRALHKRQARWHRIQSKVQNPRQQPQQQQQYLHQHGSSYSNFYHSNKSREVALVDLRECCASALLGRICFCTNADCPGLILCAVQEPSTRQLREAVLALPEAILSQKTVKKEHAESVDLVAATTPKARAVMRSQRPSSSTSLRPPSRIGSGLITTHGNLANKDPQTACAVKMTVARRPWWDVTAVSDAHVMCLRGCLLTTMTSVFLLSRDGMLRYRQPRLPRVLSLVARTQGSVEGTIERMFHVLAALLSWRERRAAGDAVVFIDISEVGPMEAENLELSVADFTFFFSDLVVRADSDDGSGGSASFPLEVDAQLLKQVEGSSGVTLSLLLSSHWGRALIASQF